MKKVLILEDEKNIREFVAINLRRNGYFPLEAAGVKTASELLDTEKDVRLAIIDVMLPDGDGVSFCRKLREKNANIGIILLTARSRESDKIAGFSSGADDYVTKPFSPGELCARVDSLYRRVKLSGSPFKTENEISQGPFTLNIKSRSLFKNGEKLNVTHVEYEMMKYFMTREGEDLSREEILDAVWGKDFFGELKIVDVNIRRLRIKLEENPSSPAFIQTVWGFGYRWGEKNEKERTR